MSCSDLFITGTDTGIGKTVITTLATAGLRSRGIDAVPMKAVQTGCTGESELVAPDLELALEGTDLAVDPDLKELLAPCRYSTPCSPHLAARLESKPLDPARIISAYKQLSDQFETVLLEGAGGLLVPLTENYLLLDLVETLELSVLLVSRPDLGTINHTLLSLEALRGRGLEVLGVVFDEPEPIDWGEIERDNLRIIEKLGEVPVWGRVEYLEDFRERLREGANVWENIEATSRVNFDLPGKLLEAETGEQ